MSVTDDDVQAAVTRWRAYRAGRPYPPDDVMMQGVRETADAETLADALLAWEGRFGGHFPPGFFAAPTPKPTTQESP